MCCMCLLNLLFMNPSKFYILILSKTRCGLWTSTYPVRLSSAFVPHIVKLSFSTRRLHTQKRHRPVTACCTFRPDTGIYDIIAVLDCCRLYTDCSELTVSDWNSMLGCQDYQADVTEWYRYVGNRLLQSVRTGCNRHDGQTALISGLFRIM